MEKKALTMRRPFEPVDDWLHNEGYFRKHAPWDSTCLFRAIAEQVYTTQYYHLRVRRECVNFMKKNRQLFEQSIKIPLDNYLEQMSRFTEWGGSNEILAMSLLYKREVFLFNGDKMMAESATDNGFEDKIHLCLTRCKQYESVYLKDTIAATAFSQSIVYGILYKGVFKMPNVDEMVQQMLHKHPTNIRHDKFFSKENSEIRENLTTELLSINQQESGTNEQENSNDVRTNEEKTISRTIVTPFSYRIAKALDPDIYRNTDFDIWSEMRKEVRNSGWSRWNTKELQVGGRCLVKLDYKKTTNPETSNNNNNKNNNENLSRLRREEVANSAATSGGNSRNEKKSLYGYVQEMSKNRGPVLVFIEELGEMKILPYAALQPIAPNRRAKQNNNWSVDHFRGNLTYNKNQKWKGTSWTWNNRRSKDCTLTSYKNPVDRNNNKEQQQQQGKNDSKDEGNDEKSHLNNNYTIDAENYCQGFPIIETTIEVRPVSVLLDNAQPLQNLNYNSTENKVTTSNDNQKSTVNNNNNNVSVAPVSVVQPMQSIDSSPEPSFDQSQVVATGNIPPPPVFPLNRNIMCSPDGNMYLFPFPAFNGEPPAPGSLLDRTIRSTNFSASPSLDPNGSDLPFFDTPTLRFFYNLGIEFYRATYRHGQPIQLPPNFPTRENHGNVQISAPGQIAHEDDYNSSRANNVEPSRRRDESNVHNTKLSHNNNNYQQQQTSKTFNNRKTDHQQDYPRVQRNNEVSTRDSAPIDCHRQQQSHANNDRFKEHPNARKNGSSSRNKKNRNSSMANMHQHNHHHHQQQQQQQRQEQVQFVPPPLTYRSNNHDPSFIETSKDTSAPINQMQHRQSSPVTCGANSSTNYQPPFGQQTFYMPYYPNNGEAAFYTHPPTLGFYQVPFVPEMIDGNPVIPPNHVYPTENYVQPIYPPPPYVYPQQAVYPPSGNAQTSSQQQINPQDNWYPIPAQPQQFLQYPQIQTPPNQDGPTPSPQS